VVILTRTHHALLELGFLKGIPIASFGFKAARSSIISRDTNFGPSRRDLSIKNNFMRLGLSSGIDSSL
jgi:hypothetical protein